MDSTELADLVEWKRWDPGAFQGAPRKPGIYVFRLNQAINRLKGKSDIVYIGSTVKGRRTIQDRLKDHLGVRKVERNTAYYLERVQREVNTLEVSWKALETHDEAMDEERVLLVKYMADHIEFPPLNRQESVRKIRMVEELIK